MHNLHNNFFKEKKNGAGIKCGFFYFDNIIMLLLFTAVLSLGSAFLLETMAYAQLATTNWPMFGYDASHTGRSPYEGPDTPALEWTYTTNDTGFFYTASNPAIGSDGTIYVGSSDSYFYAINPDGTLKWRYKTEEGSYGGGIFGGIFSSPAIDSDGTIYFGAEDKFVYALNPDGTLKWKYERNGEPHELVSSPVIGSDGTVYIGEGLCVDGEGYFYALNPDGTEKWRYHYEPSGGVSEASPAIGPDGTIYVAAGLGYGSEENYIYALNADGTLKWSYQIGDHGLASSPAIGSDGTVYIGVGLNLTSDNSGGLYAFDPNDGSLVWKYEIDSIEVVSSPAIASDGTIYFGSEDNTLYAINTDGTLKWTLADVGAHHGHPVIDSAGTIYIGSCAVNPDGSLKWRYDYKGGFSSGISSNGTLYINVCTATPGYIAAITSSTENSDTDTSNSTDNVGEDGSGGGGGGVFGAISINNVIGYHLDGITKNGTRVYMPVTNGYKALKGAQTHIEGFAPFLVKMIRNSLDSFEVMAEANKEGLLYRIGTYAYPVFGKIAELYLETVGAEELMTNAYSSTIISVAEFDKQNKEGTAISPHIVKEIN